MINGGNGPVTLRVDAVDGLTGVTSGAVYANRQARKRGAGRWVFPAVRMVSVPAGGEVTVGFVVRVPRLAKAGDHLAGLAFEDTQPVRSPGKFAVTEIVREVVGVEITVRGRARPRLGLYSLALKPLPGTAFPSLVVLLGDAGAKLCKPRLAVSLSGPGGARRVIRQLDTLLPGNVIPYPFPWVRPLRAGRYRARVNATGCGRRVTITRNLDLPTALTGTSADPAGSRTTRAHAGIPPLPLLLVALGGLGAGAALSRRRRHGLPRLTR